MKTSELIILYIYSLIATTAFLLIVFWITNSIFSESLAEISIFTYFVWIMTSSVASRVKNNRKIKSQEFQIKALKEIILDEGIVMKGEEK